DVTLTKKWQEMVLAETIEVDVLDDDHLVVIDREQCAVQDLVDVGIVSIRQKFQRLLDAFRRIQQPLAARVLSELRQQLPDELLHFSILYLWSDFATESRRHRVTATFDGRREATRAAGSDRGTSHRVFLNG